MAPDPFSAVAAGDALRAGASLASGAVNGMLQRPKLTLIKLGSRDERREVYSSFLSVSLRLLMLVDLRNVRLSKLATERQDEEWKTLADDALEEWLYEKHTLHAEYLHRLAEVELISSPRILAIARAMARQMENIWLRTKRYDANGKVRSGTGGVCYVFWPVRSAPSQHRALRSLGLL